MCEGSSRNLELLGSSPLVSQSEYSGFVSSGVFQSAYHSPAGSNQFRLVAHPSMMGVLGLFNVWVSGPSEVEDMVVSLWVVLGFIKEGFTRQVLHHPDGVRRKRKSVECDVEAWWGEVRVIAKWGPGSRKWEGELVRFQCVTDGMGFRYTVHLNWTPVCWS